MTLSSSTRHLLWDVLGWGVLCGSLVMVSTRLDDIHHLINQATHSAATERPAGSSDSQAEAAASADPVNGDAVEIAADRQGHYQTEAEINGRSFEAMVDTGATYVALTFEDAERAGIFLRDGDFTIRMQTANGVARAAPVRLDRVGIGNILLRDVDAIVGQPGALRTNLLGMSFVRRLHGFEIQSGRLVIRQ